MPGITIIPGTAWEVRPLAQYTRPLVWPQARKGFYKPVPDQFQSRWVDDTTVPVPQYAITNERLVILRHPGASYLSTHIGGSPYRNPLIVRGARYFENGTYSVLEYDDNNHDLFDHFQPSATGYMDGPGVILIYNAYGLCTDYKARITGPMFEFGFDGWPAGSDLPDAENQLIQFLSLLSSDIPDAIESQINSGTDHGVLEFDVYRRYGFSGEAKEPLWTEESGLDVYEQFREKIDMEAWCRIHVTVKPITEVFPEAFFIQYPPDTITDYATGGSYSATFYHKSVPYVHSASGPTIYTRQLWNGGGYYV